MSRASPVGIRRFRPLFLSAILLLAGLAAPGPAALARSPGLARTPGGGVTVTVTENGAGVAGAFVAVGGVGGHYAGETDAIGQAALAGVPDGSYRAVAAMPGTTVGTGTLTVAGGAGTAALTLAASGNKFTGLAAYGAQTGTILADGRSGVFYLTTTSVPSLFRTSDYGGSWVPVTVTDDDPTSGIDGRYNVQAATTSGFPGEIAAVAGNQIWYSRDFGTTWSAISTAGHPLPPSVSLFWGHAGNVSVLLAADQASTAMYYVDLPTDANPTLVPAPAAIANSFKQDPNDRLALANGAAAPVLAVAAAAGGTVTLYALGAAPDRLSAVSLGPLAGTAPSSASTFVRLGGPTTGPQLPSASGNDVPSTLLVYSGTGNGAAVMSTLAPDGSIASTTTTDFKGQDTENDAPGYSFWDPLSPNSCGANPQAGAIGSVSPLGSAGSVASCWVTRSGSTLTVRPVDNINNNTGLVYDAGYDGSTDLVLISGDGSKGALKSASMDPTLNRPVFPTWPTQASAGTGSGTGGVSIDGINAAVVTGVAFGATASDAAVMLSFSGGGRTLATSDGGATWVTIAPRGGAAIDDWPGAAGGSWILAGSGGGGNMLGDLSISAASPLSASSQLFTLPNTTGADFGLTINPPYSPWLTAIRGIPGTSTAYVGTTLVSAGSPNRGGGSLARVTLSADGTSATLDRTGLGGVTASVASLDYCPASGSAASVGDALVAALGASTAGGTDGGVAVFAGAATSPAAKSTSAPGGDYRTVRVACASGVIYAGATVAPGGSGLLESTDGGATFTPVTIGGAALNAALVSRFDDVAAIAIDPANPRALVVADGQGDMIASGDGGTTWTVENDTALASAKHFGGERPGDVRIPQGGGSGVPVTHALAPTFSPSQALVGSGAGLFSAAVRPSSSSSGRVYLPVVVKPTG